MGKLGVVFAAGLVIALVGYFAVSMVKQAGDPADANNVIQNPHSSDILGKPTDEIVEETKPPVVESEVTVPKTVVSKVSQENQTTIFEVEAETETEILNLKIIFGENCWLDGKLNNESSIINGTYEKGAIFEQTITKEQLHNNEGSLVFNIGNATGMVMTVNDEVIEIDQTLEPHQYITINMKVK